MTIPEKGKLPGAWPGRPLAGICIHFSSLPSPYGIGDIADASLAFIDKLAEMKLRVWQLLPTGPTGYGDSPYQALSTFAGNELLIGIDPLQREGLVREDELAALRALPSAGVDFGKLIPLKKALLDRAAERFLALGKGGGRRAFEAFVVRHDEAWLHDYALYRVLKSLHGERPWNQWDAAPAGRRRADLRNIEKAQRGAIDRIKAIQFFFDRQWASLREHAAERGVLLFGDLPFYIALDSADAWVGRDLLLLDEDGRPNAVAGVPPDYFSEDGQLWGNPLYDWDRHAETGYRWWISRLEEATRRCDMVRVDHFRGFESYWSVPRGAETARAGAWVPGPGDAFFRTLKRAIGDLPIVAEDLGVITAKVERLRRRHGIPGMKVLQFELGEPGFDNANIPEDCVCYTGTHDNDTSVGWFSGKERGNRTRKEIRTARRNVLRLTGGKASTIHHDLIRLAFSTRARVALAPMQDFLGLGSEARLNRPGTSDGNWRWRIRSEEMTGQLMDDIAALVAESGRT